jgi:hypothetical protein
MSLIFISVYQIDDLFLFVYYAVGCYNSDHRARITGCCEQREKSNTNKFSVAIAGTFERYKQEDLLPSRENSYEPRCDKVKAKNVKLSL